MNQFIKDYFTFDKSQRIGLLVLVLILVIIITVWQIMPLLVRHDNIDFTAFKKEIDQFQKSLKKTSAEKTDSNSVKDFDYTNVNKSSAEALLHPFIFNPNNLPSEKWSALGFDDNQIRVIKNYEAKGGKFYKKEDLKKIYGISQSEYEVLEPYIQIPESKKSTIVKTKNLYPKSEKNTVVIELNSADTTDLKKLKGIGSWYAKKIVAYRNKIGGFYKKEQIMEVKGIDSLRYTGFCDFIRVDKSQLKTININTATFEEMKAHPYIGYNIALSLINMRNQLGRFSAVTEIKKSVLITEGIYEKLVQYLTVDK